MLGCHDFCGHYDWTFGYLRRTYGQQAVHDLWSKSIGDDSQRHYKEAGAKEGLRGLYRTWVKTGEDEHCDWTFTLDEDRNVLRWDMRRCPSKGFLQDNDLNGDEDYCDHCMGWMVPLLAGVNVEVAVHEHNHRGQCWGEMRVKGKAYESLKVGYDIREDPRWQKGYLERFENDVKLPVLPSAPSDADPVEILDHLLRGASHLTVLGRGPSAAEQWASALPREAVLVTDPTYALADVFDGDPAVVLIGDRPAEDHLKRLAERYLAAPPQRRPILVHAYLPAVEPPDFVALGLPRPLPILPRLLRGGLYRHQPGIPYPTSGVFLAMLAVSLGKPVSLAGIDLYRHPSGKTYASDAAPGTYQWPERHSRACDVEHLKTAMRRAGASVTLAPTMEQALAEAAVRA